MSETRFSPYGPTNAPAARKPAIDGKRNLLKMNTTVMEIAKITSRSVRTRRSGGVMAEATIPQVDRRKAADMSWEGFGRSGGDQLKLNAGDRPCEIGGKYSFCLRGRAVDISALIIQI